ncbi:hypothetical protein RJ45_22965 [Photobacterium gaetbulicola]|uniref:MrfA-like Zn-binding domain-containing protein n=1 Tax=Photobacterium gaetbulicola TaxID=1295392 RepID=A0A0B9G7I4_9GAMM|nr:DUF1998 domain-containing protein [Photobacterium gaetbulicola]KHT60905.1 hypothetical protein RJ45_22965 [Photobacterium gaetbulicola]
MATFRRKRTQQVRRALPSTTVNQSQSVTTFGVGSLLEVRSQKGKRTRTASAIVNGLDMWPEAKLYDVAEPDLCQMLEIEALKAPPTEDSKESLPAKRFPRWLECSNCHRLGYVGQQFDEQQDGIPTCASNNCDGWGVPTRLLAVCYEEQPGQMHQSEYHIDDFPWSYWAHKDSESGTCQAPRLKLLGSSEKTGLDGLRVICDCGESKSLRGALGSDALNGIRCKGNQPWLNKSSECSHSMRALLRGASNVYFPVTASTISIPPNSSHLLQMLKRTQFKSFLSLAENQDETPAKVADMLAKLAEFAAYEKEQIEKAIDTLCGQHTAARTEQERKREEREALIADYPENENAAGNDDYEVEVQQPDILDESGTRLSEYFQGISLVHRLREVVAFRGFTRLESPMTANKYSMRCAPISTTKKNWLPAIENRGEGIYIELNQKQLQEWECRPEVMARVATLNDNYLDSAQSNVESSEILAITPRFVLLHTLSHLLIRQLSLECGYSSASLKERLYFSDDYCGVLISTASPASDGTLGGLVRQGLPSNFASTLTGALGDASWCSSDPLCIESEGQGNDALNLAACHACSLVSETSCEYRNLFLDRGLVIGTLDHPGIGFFSELS